MTPGPTLQDLIGSVRDDSPSEDPLEQLSVAVVMAGDLDTVKDELLGYFVDRCRGSGKSWTEISGALGVTRQAAHRRFNVSDPPLDRFTTRARQVVVQAPEVARACNHTYVGPEHLLLALLDDGDSLGALVLVGRGVTRRAVEAAVLMVAPRGDAPPSGPIPYNPRVVTALTGAVTSAIELGHNYVGTEHLLLALLRDQDSLAAKLLQAHQVELDDVRREIIERLVEIASTRAAPDRTLDWTQLIATGIVVDGFARFTDGARDIVVRSQEAARSLQHAYIGTEHLLLGCFGDDTSSAARVLRELDVTEQHVRDAIVRITGTGPNPVTGNIPFTPRGRARLERAADEADDLGATQIGPEHVLLALVEGDDPGLAAQILHERGVNREYILERLG